jgi:rhodanese-related sulfurtransferase
MRIKFTRREALALPVLAIAAKAAPAGWNDSDTMMPEALAAKLKSKTPPMTIHTGFGVLYRSKHIPGSVYAGPGNKPEGIELLKKAVAGVPKDREIVLYCGCCPWVNCPNMKPAFATLKEMGFTNVKAVIIETNFAKDWVDKGYPVELGSASGA